MLVLTPQAWVDRARTKVEIREFARLERLASNHSRFTCRVSRYTWHVVSYAEVAQGVGAPRAVRAAASACARNKIGVLIPCHRGLRQMSIEVALL